MSNNSAVYTFTEGSYHLGVGVLLNSLIQQGFSGTLFIFFRNEPPPWIGGDRSREKVETVVQGVRVIAIKQDPPRHFGYHKPFTALEIFEQNPAIEILSYADPDIIFLSPWRVFKEWAQGGFGVVMDANFSIVPESHPWRQKWKKWLTQQNFRTFTQTDYYANSGFFICSRKTKQLLNNWADITTRFEEANGDTQEFHQESLGQVLLTGDQDALAMAIMISDTPVSWCGREGMGFTGHHFLLSHAVEKPKPWEHLFLMQALKGRSPSVAAGKWLQHTSGPIMVLSKAELIRRRLCFKLAQLITRIWKRS